MHLHHIRIAVPAQAQRPAKVIALEARRKARVETVRLERRPPRRTA